MKIINPAEFDFEWFQKIPLQKRGKGNPANSTGIKYKNIICAFDIETTSLPEIEQSFMYIWQWAFGKDLVVIGRTWEELLEFQKELTSRLPEKVFLLSFIHNASFEFQFISGIYQFKAGDVFALDSRKVAKFSMFDCLEFRCSYIHSNMGLALYCKKMGVEHQKLDGDVFDYQEKRYPWTKLTDRQLEYCINDVVGLVEAIEKDMDSEGDNLYTFPLTSTGYVRRDVKRAMKQICHLYVKRMLPNYHIFCMLREAFRGGDTHASRFYSGLILDGDMKVYSRDRSSSYPDVLCNCKFPCSFFFEDGAMDKDELLKLMFVRKRAILMRIAFFNYRSNLSWGCPYLSKSKCRNIQDGVYDNGRVLSASYLETTITDVDFEILLKESSWEDFNAFDVAHAKYDYLPQPLIDTIIHYYKIKTELKGDESQNVFYEKSKNKLNSIYGLMAQCPIRIPMVFDESGWHWDFTKSEEELLEESNKKAFLTYAWGCWTTALARLRLHEGLWLTKEDGCEDGEDSTKFVYCDTDSIKHLGFIDFSKYNKQRIKDSKKSGAFATDSKGITHYMGVFENETENGYDEFSTLGAKKYVYREDGELHCTIAGVNKKKGGKELEKNGGLKAFKDGFVFREAGGTESVYNDNPNMIWKVDGKEIPITSNIYIHDSTYTLGITDEYRMLLDDPNMMKKFFINY